LWSHQEGGQLQMKLEIFQRLLHLLGLLELVMSFEQFEEG
jgi:hypothetical protein